MPDFNKLMVDVAALLKEEYGEDWQDRIKMYAIDLKQEPDESGQILGHLYGEPVYMIAHLLTLASVLAIKEGRSESANQLMQMAASDAWVILRKIFPSLPEMFFVSHPQP